MTDKQAERLRRLWEGSGRPNGVMTVTDIPPDSVVVWGPNWLEVVDPEATGMLSWDLGGPVVKERGEP